MFKRKIAPSEKSQGAFLQQGMELHDNITKFFKLYDNVKIVDNRVDVIYNKNAKC